MRGFDRRESRGEDERPEELSRPPASESLLAIVPELYHAVLAEPSYVRRIDGLKNTHF